MTNKQETLSEVIARLESDPIYQAKKQSRQAELDAFHAKWEAQEKNLVAELSSVGVKVGSVWDLVSTKSNYDVAIPILLKHLQIPYLGRLREGIARSLAIPQARIGWPIMVEEFCRITEITPDTVDAKDGLAAALAGTVTEETMPTYLQLLQDRRHGASRSILLYPLKRSKNAMVRSVLEKLKDDPNLAKELKSWKRK